MSSLCPLTRCVPLYLALCLLLMSSGSNRTCTPNSSCASPVTVALLSLHLGGCLSFLPSPLTPLSWCSPPSSTSVAPPSLAVPHVQRVSSSFPMSLPSPLPISWCSLPGFVSEHTAAAGGLSVHDPLLYSALDCPSPTPLLLPSPLLRDDTDGRCPLPLAHASLTSSFTG